MPRIDVNFTFAWSALKLFIFSHHHHFATTARLVRSFCSAFRRSLQLKFSSAMQNGYHGSTFFYVAFCFSFFLTTDWIRQILCDISVSSFAVVRSSSSCCRSWSNASARWSMIGFVAEPGMKWKQILLGIFDRICFHCFGCLL